MKADLAAIEAALQERIQVLIHETLASAQGQGELSLTEIEERALRVRAQVGEQVSAALLAQQTQTPVPGPCCPQCKREMHYKGRRRRRLVTRSGEIELERPYYYCAACQQSVFPPR